MIIVVPVGLVEGSVLSCICSAIGLLRLGKDDIERSSSLLSDLMKKAQGVGAE